MEYLTQFWSYGLAHFRFGFYAKKRPRTSPLQNIHAQHAGFLLFYYALEVTRLCNPLHSVALKGDCIACLTHLTQHSLILYVIHTHHLRYYTLTLCNLLNLLCTTRLHCHVHYDYKANYNYEYSQKNKRTQWPYLYNIYLCNTLQTRGTNNKQHILLYVQSLISPQPLHVASRMWDEKWSARRDLSNGTHIMCVRRVPFSGISFFG